jgi:hypothetical protein
MKPFLSSITIATLRKKVKIRANKKNLQPEEKVYITSRLKISLYEKIKSILSIFNQLKITLHQ